MTPASPDAPTLPQPPKRADARRNYEKLLAAAREAFAEEGTDAKLDDIARRAGLGSGTLYRHFPTRQQLLEAVYVDEVEAMARAADELAALPPWEALSRWLREFVRFSTTKRALASEMLNQVDRDAAVFAFSRGAITRAGDGLLGRAQEAGVVRPDARFGEVGRLIAAIGAATSDEDEVERLLGLVLDGLRYRPAEG
ncbi:Transcriptional regulator TetR family [Patulibacter medicamentivorans]|jgi:AcrR family transcriptional regulator|uniref:Transcriptional regulator TetR family n=1 Tax=Patulibacter medicamentivorans TaxID=1097667 RepID=H0E8E7_9ACTN|nr:TetR/AcrR family transcriptional regulator [Patulibacter medicamentivorans]EHN10037.1 Transcriptional regulator TetR family [Patulibacter medicamentivorans]